MGEGDLYNLSLGTCSNQFLIGTQQVAWLHFSTVSNQTSAFVYLNLDNTVGQQPDGTEVRNFAAQSGRLVIIGEQPLLEAIPGANGQHEVILYGKPGGTYTIHSTPVLEPAAPKVPPEPWWPQWQLWQGPQETLFQSIPIRLGTNTSLFLRARRE